MTDTTPALLADIGGTNARFALAEGANIVEPRIFRCADFTSLDQAAEAYLAAIGRTGADRPKRGAFDVAGPVTGDEISFTNLVWKFSIEKTRQTLRFDQLKVINDFAAVAACVPKLAAGDRMQVGAGAPAEGVIGVLGAGSGLGVGGLAPTEKGWKVLPGEGGHVTMAAADDREAAVLAVLRQRYGHVSAERVLSGPGIVNLYTALCALEKTAAREVVPADVTTAALDGSDPICVEAVSMFSRMLGTVAGNLALTLGALGGVYIAGGIVPRLGDFFAKAGFRAQFEDRGPMTKFVAPIPTYVITHPLPAFLGLIAALED
jgi:glucokinase